MNEIKWNDRFNIGVDSIDKAHQKLFLIVRKIAALNGDKEKQEHVCKETIKYFKSYTVKHFAEEEEYMRSIDYSGYTMHKRLHDNLKEKVLPVLEEEMEEQQYSEESVQHVLGFCLGWLTDHVMIEDHAITGRVSNKWIYDYKEEEIAALERAVIQTMQDVFRRNTQLVSEHYGGEDFGEGIYFRLTYLSETGEKMQVFLGFEEKMILRVFGEMLGRQLKRVDKTVLYALEQLSQQIVKHVGVHFTGIDAFRLEALNRLTHEQIIRAFEKAYPHYSLLFNVGQKGYFAFCIKKYGN